MTSVLRHTSFGGRIITVAMLLLSCWMLPSNLSAAEDKDKESGERPEPEEIDLQSSDGLQLLGTYYAGTKGKKTVPVVILHDVGESSEDYVPLALYLQKKGHAVVLPDIRGHGRSTQIKRETGRDKVVNGKRLSKNDMRLMILADMGAIRTFLLKEHNAGNLNIEKLCLVGTGVSALVAMGFAVEDWSWDDLAFKKQGKDVKALVLISPVWSFKKFNVNTFIDNRRVRGKLSLLLMVGEDEKKSFDVSRRIHTRLSNFYPEPEEKEAAKAKALFFVKRDTVFQGEKLINTPEFNCSKAIAGFIQARLVRKKIPWQDRSDP